MTPKEVFDLNLSRAINMARKYSSKVKKAPYVEIEVAAMTGLWLASVKYHNLPDDQFRVLSHCRIIGEIKDYLRARDWQPKRVRKEFGDYFHNISIDGIPDCDRDSIEYSFAIMPDAEEDLDRKNKQDKMLLAIDSLPKRTRDILMYVMSGRERKKITEEFGISHPRVSQIVKDAVKKLRLEMH